MDKIKAEGLIELLSDPLIQKACNELNEDYKEKVDRQFMEKETILSSLKKKRDKKCLDIETFLNSWRTGIKFGNDLIVDLICANGRKFKVRWDGDCFLFMFELDRWITSYELFPFFVDIVSEKIHEMNEIFMEKIREFDKSM